MVGMQVEVGGSPPALVGLDLLLDVLTVGALGSLLGHGHQLDQLGPGEGAGGRGERGGPTGCWPSQQPRRGLPPTSLGPGPAKGEGVPSPPGH